MTEIKFNADEFQREFRLRVMRSRKTLSEVVNWTAFRILRRLIELAPRARKSDIENLAGVQRYQKFGKKGKLLKKLRTVFNKDSRFRAIFAAELRRKGKNPKAFGKGAFDEAMRKRLLRRIAAVGFLASGWVKPLRKMVAAIGGGSVGNLPKMFPRSIGDGTPAKFNDWSPSAEFYNGNGMNSGPEDSRRRVEQMLSGNIERAFAEETNEMHDHAVKELNRALGGGE